MLVPFCAESVLSSAMKKVVPDQCLGYHKEKDNPMNRKRWLYEDTTNYHNRIDHVGDANIYGQGPTIG
jgi:hypothetical protein